MFEGPPVKCTIVFATRTWLRCRLNCDSVSIVEVDFCRTALTEFTDV